jgi:hypothetical protein
VQPREMLEKPDAAAAVHLRKIERDVLLGTAGKIQQLHFHIGMIEEAELAFAYFYPLAETRGGRDRVIIAKTFPVEDIINHPAALAAKRFIVMISCCLGAFFPAMITGNGGKYRGFSRHFDCCKVTPAAPYGL